jgi:hypothetical protein
MHKGFWFGLLRGLKCLLLIAAVGLTGAAFAAPDAAAALREKHASLGDQLRQNQFKRPLVLDSVETPERLTGDIYAIIDHPFDAVRAGLSSADHWCDVMILHINTKYCHAVVGPTDTSLRVHIGKKTPESLADAPRIVFNYRVAAATPDYLDIMLNAKEGPLGTSDYRIQLEVVALPNSKSFMHLTYSYSVNFVSKMAMQTYLGTIGSGKVGFTVVGKQADGQPAYIDGVRGLVERNTMRYYLAINSFLDAAGAEPAAQLEKRLQSWFTAVERYPRQLHEMDRAAYLAMKRAEHLRQQTLQ